MTVAALLFVLAATPGTSNASGPVLLDFHAEWCGPCQQMRPVIDELVAKGYPVRSIDIDQSPKLAARYRVTEVPTFIVVDASGRQLERVKGANSGSVLAGLYRRAKEKLQAAEPEQARDDSDAPERDGDETEDDANGEDEPAAPAARHTNPKPWQTVVRIRIDGNGMIGFGSGTIIYSTPEESIILTCAHIFKMEGRRQAPPSRFPHRIMVDLFDGELHGQQVHYANESFAGQAIDYDFGLDVGVIRIRPGRRLPAARVVPPHWAPKPRMLMTTVGCSEGHDATAWSTTIINPKMRGALTGSGSYEAIECWHAPKQGRSGGGLFTQDGYIAGVCDFAEPRGNHGLYASPASIYRLLDRNRMTALYSPGSKSRETLVADRGNAPKRRSVESIARGQSPDGEESGAVTIPPPEMLGIVTPGTTTRPADLRGRRTAWHPTPRSGGSTASGFDRPETTAIRMAPEVGDETFETPIDRVEQNNSGLVPIAEKPHSPSRWRRARASAEGN